MIKIWNKTSPINGVSAKVILEARHDLRDEQEIILILDAQGNVTNIEIPSILKANLGLSNELTALEVGQAYVDYLEQQKLESEKEAVTIEQVKQENEQLGQQVSDLEIRLLQKDKDVEALGQQVSDLEIEVLKFQTGGTK